MVVFLLLSIRLAKLQLMPSIQVLSTSEQSQVEKVNDTKFELMDCNGNNLLNFDDKYVLVIDKKPFSLNNYEETLKDLLTLNFIMQAEDKKFNFSDVMKREGKSYYNISKEAYDKIRKLTSVKGIYVYTYEELQRDEAWSVEGIITNPPEKYKIQEGSFDQDIYDLIENNEEIKHKFELDDKSVYSKKEVVDNNDKIQLTIDKDIEDQVRDILNSDQYKNYKNIGVMILESDTGKIKAMVQKDETEANVNLGIEGMGYEPGSVYKLITLGAALEEGKVSMNDTFTCKGKICKEEVHGTLTVKNALVKSCNDIFAEIGEKAGYDKMMEYSKKLGLFSPVLNIRGEGRNEAEGEKPLESSGMTNISIGQCLTVTPIQVLGFTNAIVNNGTYIKPYLIDKVLDQNNNVVKEITPYKEQVFSKTTCGLVKNAMKDVVSFGTGKKARVENILTAGKTGSATGSNNTTHGWFAGYFIKGNKQYTMTVFVPNINGKDAAGEDLGGGSTAAPIFAEIAKKISN